MLELKNLSFSVNDGNKTKQILKDINLVIDDKKFTVITGPNGGGKSTLAKIIMGIEKPTSGKIFFNGEDITDWDITKRALAGISFAFQQPVRFKGIGVKDLLSLAAGEKLSTSGACTYLSEVGLCAADYVNREVDTSLSGGEIKRIEIATILARKQTKLAVFDEQQQSIMIISHQERILNIADQIVLVANGSIKQIGTKEEIMPQLMEVAGVCDFYKK